MTQPVVMLSVAEVRRACMVGIARVIESRGRRARFRYRSGDVWRAHIMGALAEAVVAKHTGWANPEGVNTFRSVPDVGDCEVRWSGQDPPSLKVRNDEQPETRLVLVSGDGVGEPFRIRGWALAREASDLGQWYEAREAPCWFVPHERLHAIEELVGQEAR